MQIKNAWAGYVTLHSSSFHELVSIKHLTNFGGVVCKKKIFANRKTGDNFDGNFSTTHCQAPGADQPHGVPFVFASYVERPQ